MIKKVMLPVSENKIPFNGLSAGIYFVGNIRNSEVIKIIKI